MRSYLCFASMNWVWWERVGYAMVIKKFWRTWCWNNYKDSTSVTPYQSVPIRIVITCCLLLKEKHCLNNLEDWHKTFDICRAPGQFTHYTSQDWVCYNCSCSAFASHLQNVAMLAVEVAPLNGSCTESICVGKRCLEFVYVCKWNAALCLP